MNASSWQASAPGKLVLVGEYAVLEGHPAMAMAVDCRAQLHWAPRDSSQALVDLTPLSTASIELMPTREALGLRWQPGPNESLDSDVHVALDAVLDALLSWAPEAMAQSFHLAVDTQPLFAGQKKLGLGSSAAVHCGLAGLASALCGRDWTDLESLHQHVWPRHQSGMGSGIDLATVLVGGVLVYACEINHHRARWQSSGWLDALQGWVVFTGQSAQTPDLIQGYRQWQNQSPRAFDQCMRTLGQVSADVISCWQAGDDQGFLEGFTEYGVRMGTMGGLMGQDVVTATHEQVATVARSHRVGYKPCGAGGGDVGLLLSREADALEAVVSQLAEMGMMGMRLSPTSKGLAVGPSNQTMAMGGE